MKTYKLHDYVAAVRLAVELGDTWELYRLLRSYKIDDYFARPIEEEGFIEGRAEERYLETGRRYPA